MQPKARRLSEMLPKLTRAAFSDRGFSQGSILTDWIDVVGAETAAKSCPEKISRDGVLTLRVDGSVAVEIQHLEPQILERIASHFGYRAVTRIRIRQGLTGDRGPT